MKHEILIKEYFTISGGAQPWLDTLCGPDVPKCYRDHKDIPF